MTLQRLDQNLDKFQGKLNQAAITNKVAAKTPFIEHPKLKVTNSLLTNLNCSV